MNPSPDLPEGSNSPNKGLLYAAIPVGLIVASVVGNFVMIRIATADPAFSVERDYYQKAVNWDQEMAQAELNRKLGYSFRLEEKRVGEDVDLAIVLVDSVGKPIAGAEVSGEAFPNARAMNITTLGVQSDGLVHRARIAHARPGVWELRLEAKVAGQKFTATERRELGGGT
ncbi:MAG: FixH family protein [Deltaproteobacteria bacterium]|nr:FixH family protein [Deltaproteobacteria bacterium]